MTLPLVPCYKCGKSLPPKDADGIMTCECGATDIDYRCEKCGQEREHGMGCAPCDAAELAQERERATAAESYYKAAVQGIENQSRRAEVAEAEVTQLREALQTLRVASARYHGEATNAGAASFPPYLITAIEQADAALKEVK